MGLDVSIHFFVPTTNLAAAVETLAEIALKDDSDWGVIALPDGSEVEVPCQGEQQLVVGDGSVDLGFEVICRADRAIREECDEVIQRKGKMYGAVGVDVTIRADRQFSQVQIASRTSGDANVFLNSQSFRRRVAKVFEEAAGQASLLWTEGEWLGLDQRAAPLDVDAFCDEVGDIRIDPFVEAYAEAL